MIILQSKDYALPYRFFIQLSFKGTHYHGWQIQPNAITVQQTITDGLSKILNEEIQISGAGRTDTGVHAKCFYAHFDSSIDLSQKTQKLAYQLNGILPDDISVQQIFKVKADIHARFSALSRTYKYFISKYKDPFTQDSEYTFFGPLEISQMEEASKILFEYKDFTSFSRLHTQTGNNLCDIFEAYWKEDGDKIVFTIKANRFLRNMVRAIVGTLLLVGSGKIDPMEMHEIIKKADRSGAGPSAPAQGLILTNIEYPDDFAVMS